MTEAHASADPVPEGTGDHAACEAEAARLGAHIDVLGREHQRHSLAVAAHKARGDQQESRAIRAERQLARFAGYAEQYDELAQQAAEGQRNADLVTELRRHIAALERANERLRLKTAGGRAVCLGDGADIVIADGAVLTITLPGLTGIRIDATTRLIAVDGYSGDTAGGGLLPEWRVADLRDGTYGDFHRLRPPGECPDPNCVAAGQHAIATAGEVNL